MRVFHFINEKYGLENLHHKRLKISNLMDLNDPFEFYPENASDATNRKTARSAKETLDQHLGLICFSRSWKSPVQWSHYADRHRGICLGFDIPDDHATEITYIKKRLPSGKTRNIKERLSHKFNEWKYEKEIRTFLKLDSKTTEIQYKEFSESLMLTNVIIGANSSLSRKTMKTVLDSYDSNIETFKVRAAFNSFKMVRNQNDALWK